ncbi:uncharacterized protein LOC143244293 isoform X1 [Tachypleus tridentatus]|uniref:uncharacterized protein LOC143244293 isoform X1 n=1 Tax=Tachypleus tridentatus TaxID=6853 RepID=UPI003FD02F7F
MYGSCVVNPETRPQLVPSPSHGSGDAGSPLSLEHWYVSDLDAWLRDSEVPSQELTKPILSIHQRQQMNTRLVSSLPTYGNSSTEPNVHVRDSSSKLTGSVTSYQHSVHVNIPSPVSSFNTIPAESPTLYDSVLPTSNLTKDSNTYSSIPYLPIPVHEIKHELPDNYNCNNDDLLSASGFLRNLIKTEEEVTCSYQLSQEKFQQVQYLAMEQVSRHRPSLSSARNIP